MKLFPLFIALILFGNFGDNFAKRMIMLQPLTGISEFYSERAVPYGDASITRFSDLAKEHRKKLCVESIDVVGFTSLKADAELPKINQIDSAAEIQSYVQDIENLYKSTSIDPILHVSVKVEFEPNRSVKTLRGIMCTIRIGDPSVFWSIEDGLNSKQFYVLSKRSTSLSANLYFLGLVEEAATDIDEETIEDVAALEASFLKGHKLLMGHRGQPLIRSIHHLNNLNRLRACSSVYMIWTKDATVDGNFRNFVRETDNISILFKPTSIQFTTIDLNDSEYFQSKVLNLLPCAINTIDEKSSPQFYLVADQAEKGAAFALTEKYLGTVKTYSIVMRLKNVLGLETLE